MGPTVRINDVTKVFLYEPYKVHAVIINHTSEFTVPYYLDFKTTPLLLTLDTRDSLIKINIYLKMLYFNRSQSELSIGGIFMALSYLVP